MKAREERRCLTRRFSLAMMLNDLSGVSGEAGIIRNVISEHNNDTWVKIFVRATVFLHVGPDFTT